MKSGKICFVFVVGCLLLGGGDLFAAPTADNIVAFGDSITHGYGSVPYAEHLQGLINAAGGGATVLNYGKDGETTVEGLSRIGDVLAATAPRYVLIMEGANDVIDGISAETTAWDIGAMIDKASSAGAVPIVSTLTPNSREGDHPQIANDYNPAIVASVAAKGATQVDCYTAVVGNWSGLSFDGLHPNNDGAAILAQTFYTALPYGGGATAAAGDGGGGGGGGCFIATAAFGSLLEPHVVLLQEFRDAFLLTNTPGRIFVQLYYRYSPPIADIIAEHAVLRGLVRVGLYPLIGLSYVCLQGAPYGLLLLGSLLLLMIGFALRFHRKKCLLVQ